MNYDDYYNGQTVICVSPFNLRNNDWSLKPILKVGSMYTIKHVRDTGVVVDDIGIEFHRDHFITIPEARKLKLKEIYGEI